MSNLQEKFKYYIMYLSYKETQKRKYNSYKQTVAKLKELAPDELNAEYVFTKAKYENKKSILSIFIISMIIAIITNIWKFIFNAYVNIIKIYGNLTNSQINEIGFYIFLSIALPVSVFIIWFIVYYIKNLNSLYIYLLTIEEIKKENI